MKKLNFNLNKPLKIMPTAKLNMGQKPATKIVQPIQQKERLVVEEILNEVQVERATETGHLAQSDDQIVERFQTKFKHLKGSITKKIGEGVTYSIEDEKEIGKLVMSLLIDIKQNPELFSRVSDEDIGVMTLAARETYAKMARAKDARTQKKVEKQKRVQGVVNMLGNFSV